MARRIVLPVMVVGLAGLAALSAMTALAGGHPLVRVASVLTGGETRDGGERGERRAEAISAIPEADDAHEGDAENEGVPAEGRDEIAQAIADSFGATKEQVLSLHDRGIGFGAIFKLLLLSEPTGKTVDQLLADMKNAGGEVRFAFGQRFRTVELAADAAKNLGELLSAARKSGGGAESAARAEMGGASAAEAGEGGHAACSAATDDALAHLQGLQGDGRPVDQAIEAVMNCGSQEAGIIGEGHGPPALAKAHGRP